MIEVRQVYQDSAAALSELCKITFIEAYNGVDSNEDIAAYCEKNYSVAAIETNLSNPEMIYKVAYRISNQETKAVGYLMIQEHDCFTPLDENRNRNTLELKQIYVLANEFGSGLGELLLDETIEYARTSNKNWVWLCVSDVNTRAISFYEKQGFEVFGPAPVLEVGNSRLSATLMKLML